MIDKLWEVYINEEYWHKERIDRDTFNLYCATGIEEGWIIPFIDEEIIAYIEVWCVDYHTFGRIICGEKVSALDVDVKNGNIGYLANVWIDKRFRNSDMIKQMKRKFFEVTAHCDYFVGEARRKKSQPVKVYKKSDLLSLTKQEQ